MSCHSHIDNHDPNLCYWISCRDFWEPLFLCKRTKSQYLFTHLLAPNKWWFLRWQLMRSFSCLWMTHWTLPNFPPDLLLYYLEYEFECRHCCFLFLLRRSLIMMEQNLLEPCDQSPILPERLSRYLLGNLRDCLSRSRWVWILGFTP